MDKKIFAKKEERLRKEHDRSMNEKITEYKQLQHSIKDLKRKNGKLISAQKFQIDRLQEENDKLKKKTIPLEKENRDLFNKLNEKAIELTKKEKERLKTVKELSMFKKECESLKNVRKIVENMSRDRNIPVEEIYRSMSR